MKLKIQMIPKTMYGKNVRSILSKGEWQRLSRTVREHSCCTCEICGKQVEDISKLEAHEEWEYIVILKSNGKKKYIQRLRRIRAVCKNCHRVIHIGRTSYGKHYKKAIKHFMKVNGCSYRDFGKAERKAYKKYAKRSIHKWKLDINRQYLDGLLRESD